MRMQVLRGICIFCFAKKGGGKIDTRKRITIRLPQDVYGDILDNLGNAASSTFNSFMANAARFYLGYIKARETEDYLSKTLLSIISARQERSDKATVSVLYALAVELNILQRILVSHFDIPDEVYAELRRKARADKKQLGVLQHAGEKAAAGRPYAGIFRMRALAAATHGNHLRLRAFCNRLFRAPCLNWSVALCGATV